MGIILFPTLSFLLRTVENFLRIPTVNFQQFYFHSNNRKSNVALTSRRCVDNYKKGEKETKSIFVSIDLDSLHSMVK